MATASLCYTPVFSALAETQTAVTPFIEKYRSHFANHGLDVVEATNARRLHEEKFGNSLWQVGSLLQEIFLSGRVSIEACYEGRS